jgi:CheY-like chemotaxis protein
MFTVFCLLFGISHEFQIWNLYLFFLYEITSNLDIIMLTEQQNFRIMLVENEKDILRVIKRGLESSETNDTTHKFKVDAYQDSELALQSFQNHPDNYYDLVLTDIRMSKITGFELYRRLKERSPSIEIVFLTAFEIDRKEFDKILADAHFIIKPVSISNLIPKLNSILDKK